MHIYVQYRLSIHPSIHPSLSLSLCRHRERTQLGQLIPGRPGPDKLWSQVTVNTDTWCTVSDQAQGKACLKMVDTIA